MFTDFTGEGFWSDLWNSVKSFGENLLQTPNYIIESFNFEVGVGAGMALETDTNLGTIKAGVVEDFVTIKKGVGDTDIKIGQQGEWGDGITIGGAFFGRGERKFYDFRTKQTETEVIEPHMDINMGNSIKIYYGLGFSASIGFDMEHFLNRFIFG